MAHSVFRMRWACSVARNKNDRYKHNGQHEDHQYNRDYQDHLSHHAITYTTPLMMRTKPMAVLRARSLRILT